MRTPLLLLLVAALAGCPQVPNTPPCPPDADAASPTLVDAGFDSDTSTTTSNNDLCGVADQNLMKLTCKDARGRLIGGPNLHGVLWSQICRDDKTNGVDLKPACIAAAKNCAEVMSCR